MSPALHYFECRGKHSCELYIVEGKHAANAVNRARSKDRQSVLAMQGKVPNVAKLGLQRQIDKNHHVGQLTTVLESWASPSELVVHRYSSVVILSDPDVDGVHAAMLLTCLLGEAFPNLVREECLLLCRCPLFLIASDKCSEELIFYNEVELERYRSKDGRDARTIQRFKGVASLSPDLLRTACIDPHSRKVTVVSEADCAAIKNRLT